MSDLFGNHIVGFSTRRLICGTRKVLLALVTMPYFNSLYGLNMSKIILKDRMLRRFKRVPTINV